MKKIKVQVDENRHLISYCEIGNLSNSIEIEVDDDFGFVENLRNYVLQKNNTLKLEIDIEYLKKIKRDELKASRDETIKSNLEVKGALIQVKTLEDRDKFNRILLGLLLGKLRKNDKEEWRLADNTYKTFTYAELAEIPEIYSDREREAFKKFHILDNRLNACKSVEEIEAIKWE